MKSVFPRAPRAPAIFLWVHDLPLPSLSHTFCMREDHDVVYQVQCFISLSFSLSVSLCLLCWEQRHNDGGIILMRVIMIALWRALPYCCCCRDVITIIIIIVCKKVIYCVGHYCITFTRFLLPRREGKRLRKTRFQANQTSTNELFFANLLLNENCKQTNMVSRYFSFCFHFQSRDAANGLGRWGFGLLFDYSHKKAARF